jgi:hypothetical protein
LYKKEAVKLGYTVKLIAFWGVAPCGLAASIIRIALLIEAVYKSVYFNNVIQHCIPKSYRLHTLRLENLKSH